MKVLEVFNPKRVILNSDASSKEAVIDQLTDLFYSEKIINNKETFVASVLKRENHSTTGVGNGIAIPHGKTSVVNEPAIAFAKLNHSVEWDSLDGKPVEIVVMLAIPDSEKGKLHLSLLSEIAIKLMDDELVERLKNATTAEEVVELFT